MRPPFFICSSGRAHHSYISSLKKSSASVTSPGFLVYSVGTVPSLKHSKIVFLDSGMGRNADAWPRAEGY